MIKKTINKITKKVLPKKLYNKYKAKYKKWYKFRRDFYGIYKSAQKDPIREDKVIFMENTRLELSDNYKLLIRALERDYDLDIHYHFLGRTKLKTKAVDENSRKFLRDAATAKYIIVDDSESTMGVLQRKRKGTRLMNTWHACGAFKRFGFGSAKGKYGASYSELKKYPFHGDYDLVTVSSPEVEWAYAESFGIDKSKWDCVKGIGVSRTDVYFDEEYLSRCRENVREFFPESKGKKIILYAPTFRGTGTNAATSDALDIGAFARKLSDEYVLLVRHHYWVKELPEIQEEYRYFAKDATKGLTIEDCLVAADICITDYSSLVFEYSLFERPMLFFAYDIDDYCDWRGFYYDYDDFTPGPICSTNEEMIDYITNIDDRFDKGEVSAFREKFMSGCDGHATERIINEFFGNGIERFRK